MYTVHSCSTITLCLCFTFTHGTGQLPTITINKYGNELHEGDSVNITATIQSGPPIVSLKWGVVGGDLPPHTKNYTHKDGATLFSTLELRSLCFSYSGNYTIIVRNEDGTSRGFAPLQIYKSM